MNKPKTTEGKRSKPNFNEDTSFYNQTLDQYNFPTNQQLSKPNLFYRQYYENSNYSMKGKAMSGGSKRMDMRAVTSQSTKNTSRLNYETINSFLQTDNSNERIKTQSTLFMACQKKSSRQFYSQICEEEPFLEKEGIIKNKDEFESTLTKNNGVFYEKKKIENKFYLPIAPIYSKRMKYNKNIDIEKNKTVDESVQKAQKKFLMRKYFNDSDPYKLNADKNLKEYFRENIVKEKSHHHSNLTKKLDLNEGIITDFQNNEDPFLKNSNFRKNFKINSIIHKNPKEITKIELIKNQIRPKFLHQKNIKENPEFKRTFLIVENLYLDDGNKNRLKYCYTDLYYVKNH